MLKDARDYQIIFLSLFLLLGVAMRDWSLRPEIIGTAVCTAIVVQWLLTQVKNNGLYLPAQWFFPIFEGGMTEKPSFVLNWRSPLITALGLSLLLRTDHVLTMAIAASCAIASKFLFKLNDKHFFNPTNFGIIAALTLTQDAWISPGQWGEELWYGLIFLGAGGLVLKRVGRWDTTVMFLSSYAVLEAVRNFYLGWTWDVWAHRMMSGSLLLFALFMVTDPRSIPNARPARLTWAGAIALLTFVLRNQFYLNTAVFWALFILAPLTIVFDKLWEAPRFEWRKRLKGLSSTLAGVGSVAIFFFAFTPPAHAFCGFYVAKADTDLYNKASQVAIARQGDRTILTLSNDYQGAPSDFAMVVPVPTVIKQEQVTVTAPEVLSRLDDFSAPRLVEYSDSDPCALVYAQELSDLRMRTAVPEAAVASSAPISNAALGITIEEQFSVGEYDILILSARESDGLETWLTQNDYRIPAGANAVLAPYIRQGMKFFVAKVNLDELPQGAFQQLRPLQISYNSPRFMLPIRLGMLNAENEQDLVLYLLSPDGRTELTNYRTVNIATDVELPLFVQKEFGDFYPDMFQRSYTDEGKNVAFLEYAWDMRGCDPCSATPLSEDELRQSGVFWLDSNLDSTSGQGVTQRPMPSASVFITRLHVRYQRDKFPEDLMFQATNNQQFFQGRYVTRHAYGDNIDCAARLKAEYNTPEKKETLERDYGSSFAEIVDMSVKRQEQYMNMLAQRFEREAQNLARLTGKSVQAIRQRISDEVPQPMPSLWLMRHPASNGKRRWVRLF